MLCPVLQQNNTLQQKDEAPLSKNNYVLIQAYPRVRQNS